MKQNYLEPSRTDFSLSLLKKWLFRCWSIIMVVLLGIIIVPNSYGQTIVTEGSTVKAWFGIDADIHSNILTVNDSGFATPAYTDDWFQNPDITPTPIRGLGVIDQTDAGYWTSRVLSNYNTSFELRMSSDPDRNWEDPASGMLWIDAVYFRDNNSQGAFKDSTVFTAGSDANGANPSSWSLGIGGTPQKNDLVDVMGHMRKDENGDLYGIGAFTTISSDGNSHGDFEFFQSQVDLFEGALTNLGPDAGHTAWEFSQYAEGDVDSEGNPAIPGHYYISKVGDLIVSIDFENGGTEPQASVRLWMSDATFAGLNGMPSIPGLGFTLSGEFNSGEDATGFGYAGIVTPSTTYTIAWAVVNVDQNVLGAPWGSLEDKALYDSIQALQYAEFAINLTDLGIGDNFGGEDPCNQTLGSLMVKTRASSSFTAELKDFGGPFLFGVEYTTDITVQDLKTCVTGAESYEINLYSGVPNEFGGDIHFFEGAADTSNLASAIPNPTEFPVLADDMPKTIYARSTNTDDPSKLCYAVDSFVIDYWPEPLCDFPEEDVNYHNVTLVGGNDGWAEPQIDGGTGPFTYLWSVLPGDPEGFIPEGEEDDLRADGLTAGAYRLDIEDANGCTTWCEILISEPDAACDVTLDGAEICCPDVPVTLCATAAEGTIYSELTIFSWYTGETFDAATLYAENTGADPCQEFIVSEETTVWLVVNNQGCISEPQSAVITIDNTPLVDPVDGGETIECADDLNTPTPPAVYDNCGELIDPGEPVISPTPDCVGDVTYTWTYTDCLDREVQYIYTFTILPPVVNIPDDGGMEVACPADIVAPPAPELFDNCGRPLTFIGVTDPVTEVCNGPVTFTYTWEDCLGVEYTWDYVFTVLDPVVNIPDDGGMEVACPSDIVAPPAPELFDNCGRPLTFTGVTDPVTEVCNGPVTFTYTWEDCLGVEYTWDYVFTVLDPVVNIPDDGGMEVACPSDIVAPAAPELFDNCGRPLTYIGVTDPVTEVCNGPVTFTYTWEDCLGVEYTWDYVFTVLDPVVNIPDDGGMEVACPSDIVAPAAPELFDNCGRPLTFIGVTDPVTEVCNGPVTFTYTWEDCLGVEYTWDYVFTVLDPVVNIPDDGGMEVACPSDIVAPPAPELFDNCGRPLTYIGVTDPVTEVCNGPVTFTYTWEDCLGVEYTWDYVFTVLDPVVIIPDDGGMEVACPSDIVAPAAPELFDNCGRPLTYIGVTDPVTEVCNGPVTFTYTWEDCLGVEYTWDYVFTVLDPVVNIPDDGGMEVACPSDIVAPAAPELFDNCGRPLTFTGVTDPVTEVCNGPVTFTYTWEDCLGVEYTWDYVFTVLDPVVNIPDDGGMEVACPADIVAPAAPELYDNCGRMLTFIGMNDPDTEVCNEDVVFIYTYTDCLQREYTWKYTFVVKDDIPPVITIDPYDETLCNMDVPEMLTASWTDNCAEGDMLTAYAQMYMANDCDTTYFYAFEAMDDCENVSKDTAFITKESMVYDNCETAFAYYSEEISTCFIDDPDYKFNRWGWTNAISEGSYEMPLYAGAAHCELGKGLEVGTVMVDYTGASLSVEYVLFEGYVMNEAHVYVGCEPYPMKNGKATVAPGQFTYTASDLQNSGGVAINFNEVSGEMIYVIAHAVTCEVVCACSDYEGPHDGDPLIYQGVPIVCEEALEANTVYDETTGDNSKENKGKAKGNNKNITTDIAVFNLSDLKVYPNPFDDKVNIQFMTEKGGHAVLEIHNMLGQRVVRLLDKQVEAGELQRVEFKPETEISGMYLYRLDIDGDVRIGKLIYRNR